jgi:hypothetical protein
MKLNLVLSVIVICGPLAVAVGQASQPLVVISGTDSHVSKPSYERVTTPESWARIWASHLGTSKDDAYRPLLEVDFDRCLVVAVFRGDETNIRRLQVDSLSETADSVVIRFTELGYQTAGDSNDKPPDRPYAFIVVFKTSKRIVLERNFPNMLSTVPEWNEVAQLKGDPAAAE